MSNPWGLTKNECAVLDALCRHGHQKMAAKEVGIEQRSVENYVAQARRRMGAGHRISAVVMWDRWKRAA